MLTYADRLGVVVVVEEGGLGNTSTLIFDFVEHPSVSIRQHSSAFVSIRQHTSAYVSKCQHTSAYVSIRQHTSDVLGSLSIRIRQHTSDDR
jgi:hypothetical protein